jgi:hypothetical protein
VDGWAEVLVVFRCARADSVDKVQTNLLRRERTKEGQSGAAEASLVSGSPLANLNQTGSRASIDLKDVRH